MDKSELYIKHAAGVYALFAWIKEQEKLGTPCIVANQTISIHPLVSRFFSLGFNKSNKTPYIAVQRGESTWLKLISWESVTIRKNDSNVYLVAKKIQGDDTQYPDLPSFAVAIAIDSFEILSLIENIKHIEARDYSLSLGKVNVNYHSKLFKLPLKSLLRDEPYLDFNENYKNYNDIMSISENQLRDKYDNSIPEFIGDEMEAKSKLSDFWGPLNELLEKTKNKYK